MLQKPFKELHKIDGIFGESRSYGLHSGEDWNGVGGGNTDCGYNLYPIMGGEVVYANEANTGYGNVVIYRIIGPWGERYIRYCHCREILVRSGLVRPETVIATLGTSGNSTACHLHWDVIKKPMRNWRTYARDEALLKEYFEEPTAFFNRYRDYEEEEEMPEWFETLLRENNLTIKDEGSIRALFDKAKVYDDRVKELTEQVKSANEALADKALEVSLLSDRVTSLDNKVQELEEQLNQARSERDQEAWQNDRNKIEIKRLTEQIEDLGQEIVRHEKNNSLYSYGWFTRFFSLFRRG